MKKEVNDENRINKEYVKKFIENLKKLDEDEKKEYLKLTQTQLAFSLFKNK